MHQISLLDPVCDLALRAGELVMGVYEATDSLRQPDLKADGSPVTMADLLSERAICEGLRALAPDIPIISEEGFDATKYPVAPRNFWLVDPLDGTREFIHRNGEFTVNIALVRDGLPILGVVYAPSLGALYGSLAGSGAFVDRGGQRSPIRCRTSCADGLDIVGSRSHGDADALGTYLAGVRVRRYMAAGSSLKFCMVAEGHADLYPRLGRTMEWDTAAGHAVLLGAGGTVLTLDGRTLCYGKPGYENPHFCAKGS